MTAKQQAFVNEYLANGGNATEAARKAYNCADDATARAVGSENLTKPNIKSAIKAAQQKEEAQAHMSFHELMGHLAGIVKREADGTPGVSQSARVQAAKTYAELMGWEPPKKVEHTIEHKPLEEMTDDELAAVVQKG